MRALCALFLAFFSTASTWAQPKTPEVVASARRYLESWQLELAAVVAEERYEQVRSVFGRPRSGVSAWRRIETRQTVADVLFLRVPKQDAWLCFRDVFEVDGRPVRDRQQRFDALFRAPQADIATDALAIANESARFNLGVVTRNINTPVTALIFLQSAFAETIEWRFDAQASLDRRPAWLLRFRQRQPPFAVRTPGGGKVDAEGRFWLEPGEARIRETEVFLRTKAVLSRVRTTYGALASLEQWVPLRMQDEYTIQDRERVTGDARYVNHRVFQTSGRVIGSVQQF